MRGGLLTGEKKEDQKVEDTGKIYVPRAHVQFLEQAGVRVVPVDYRLSHEELNALFDKLNGLYLPGDSHNTIYDEKYKFAFMAMLDYCDKKTQSKDHFPIFMMGNSLQTLVRSRKTGQHLLTSMEQIQY